MEIIKRTDNYNKPEIIVSIDETPLIVSGGITQLIGQAKTCKSQILFTIMASMFNKRSIEIDSLSMRIKHCPTDKQVLYVNTEMSKYHSWEQLCKIHDRLQIAEKGNIEDLLFLHCTGLDSEIIRQQITDMISINNIILIIIDGVVDIIEDFNSINDSKFIIKWLESLTKSAAVLCVLHQNPNDRTVDAKSRGHLGTMLGQKSISTIITSKHKNTYYLSTSKNRYGQEHKQGFIFNTETLYLESYKNNSIADSILLSLSNGRMNSNELADKLKRSKKTITDTLKILIKENKIIKQQKGRTIYYVSNQGS